LIIFSARSIGNFINFSRNSLAPFSGSMQTVNGMSITYIQPKVKASGQQQNKREWRCRIAYRIPGHNLFAILNSFDSKFTFYIILTQRLYFIILWLNMILILNCCLFLTQNLMVLILVGLLKASFYRIIFQIVRATIQTMYIIKFNMILEHLFLRRNENYQCGVVELRN